MSKAFIHPEYLVSTEWLARNLHNTDVRVLDCTTHLPPKPDFSLYDVVPGREDFENAHIAGAAFLDVEHGCSQSHPLLHFMLPDAARFAAAMEDLGVSDQTHVIAYSTANHWWATRLWWMLRVFGHDNAAVLDGGFQKWKTENRPVESGAARANGKGRFTVRPPRRDLVAGREDVLAAIGMQGSCTINALRPEQHAGKAGVHYGRRGHIKGSVNIPSIEHLKADNTFRSAEELGALFATALQTPNIITYCGGGIAATSVALVLAMLGRDDVKVYDASLTEWAADPALPMEL